MNYAIVVLISGSGSNLQALLDNVENGSIPGKITHVISNQENAYGLERARKHGIPYTVLDHKQYPSREHYDHALQELLDALDPDLVVLAGFMRILGEKLVNAYSGKMINIHPSLLPHYRGLHTHQRVLEAKETRHGTSVHFVSSELDGGPVIAQASLQINPGETPETLQARVQTLEHQLYPQVVAQLAAGRLQLKQGIVYLDGTPLDSAVAIGLHDYKN